MASKYWVFRSNQVEGPYDLDELSELAGFSGDSLVCPEGRKGTSMGDWQRASSLSELAPLIAKAMPLATSLKEAAMGRSRPGLPPEPTLKDLAALGTLQEKVGLLDSTVSQLRDALGLKENEIASLHTELEQKSRQAQELSQKLTGLEERLSSLGSLQEGLDKAVAAEHQVEEEVHQQAKTITALGEALESLKRTKEEARPASPPMAAGVPMPAPAKPQFAPVSLPSPTPLPSSTPLPSPSPLPASKPEIKAPTSSSSVLVSPAPASGGGKSGAFLTLVLLAGSGFAAFKMGLIPADFMKRRTPAAASAPAPAPQVPAPAANAPQPSAAQAQAEGLKKQAIDLVRAWPVGSATVSAKLEAPSLVSGALSPWMADLIREDDYQVNFYSPKTSGGSGQVYEFEAVLHSKKVVARNTAAHDLLNQVAPGLLTIKKRKTGKRSLPKPRFKLKKKAHEVSGPIAAPVASPEPAAAPAASETQPLPAPAPAPAAEPSHPAETLALPGITPPAPPSRPEKKAQDARRFEEILQP